MLETAQNVFQAQNLGGAAQSGHTGARVSAKSQIEDNLSKAADGVSETSFDAAMAYAQTQSAEPETDDFGFDDIVDMINPLHHIPLVGMIYREATGDEIDPVAQIIGSAAYGGFAGAASGIVNAIVQEETGRDVGGNLVAMMQGETSLFPERQLKNRNNPEERLGQMALEPGAREPITELHMELERPADMSADMAGAPQAANPVPQAKAQIVSPYGYTTDW